MWNNCCCSKSLASEEVSDWCSENRKVKGRFGVAFVAETPCCCPEPIGWQVEFCDTPSKVEQRCMEMIQWANRPPLPRCEPCPPVEVVSPCFPPKCNPCCPNTNPCITKCYPCVPCNPCLPCNPCSPCDCSAPRQQPIRRKCNCCGASRKKCNPPRNDNVRKCRCQDSDENRCRCCPRRGESSRRKRSDVRSPPRHKNGKPKGNVYDDEIPVKESRQRSKSKDPDSSLVSSVNNNEGNNERSGTKVASSIDSRKSEEPILTSRKSVCFEDCNKPLQNSFKFTRCVPSAAGKFVLHINSLTDTKDTDEVETDSDEFHCYYDNNRKGKDDRSKRSVGVGDQLAKGIPQTNLSQQESTIEKNDVSLSNDEKQISYNRYIPKLEKFSDVEVDYIRESKLRDMLSINPHNKYLQKELQPVSKQLENFNDKPSRSQLSTIDNEEEKDVGVYNTQKINRRHSGYDSNYYVMNRTNDYKFGLVNALTNTSVSQILPNQWRGTRDLATMCEGTSATDVMLQRLIYVRTIVYRLMEIVQHCFNLLFGLLSARHEAYGYIEEGS